MNTFSTNKQHTARRRYELTELADFVRDEDIPYRETDRDWSWLGGADLRDDLLFKAALDDAENVASLILLLL